MSTPKGPPPNYASQGPNILACAIVILMASTGAVAVRIWSRLVTPGQGLWWDDWLVITLMMFSHSFLAVAIWWTTIGLGRHSWMIPFSEIINNDVANRVSLTLYAISISLIKISAVVFYARLFQINRVFKIILWVLGVVVALWSIILIILPWTFCRPVSHSIDPFSPGYCPVETQWYLASAFINAILDLTILLLPMPVVWQLHLQLKRKILVSVILLLGYCSAFLSLARFIVIVRNPDLLENSANSDPSWNLVPILFLSMLESPFAIFALCGPPAYHLARRFFKFGFRSLFSTRQYHDPLVDPSSGRGSMSRGTVQTWKGTKDDGSTGTSHNDRPLRNEDSEVELRQITTNSSAVTRAGAEKTGGIHTRRDYGISQESARELVGVPGV